MIKAVVNASPLIALSIIGQFHLLFDLFDESTPTSNICSQIVENK
jgi:hypothetical protein